MSPFSGGSTSSRGHTVLGPPPCPLCRPPPIVPSLPSCAPHLQLQQVPWAATVPPPAHSHDSFFVRILSTSQSTPHTAPRDAACVGMGAGHNNRRCRHRDATIGRLSGGMVIESNKGCKERLWAATNTASVHARKKRQHASAASHTPRVHHTPWPGPTLVACGGFSRCGSGHPKTRRCCSLQQASKLQSAVTAVRCHPTAGSAKPFSPTGTHARPTKASMASAEPGAQATHGTCGCATRANTSTPGPHVPRAAGAAHRPRQEVRPAPA